MRIIMSYRVTRFPTADFIIAVKNRFTHCITFLPVIQETIIMRFLTAKPFTSLRISCSVYLSSKGGKSCGRNDNVLNFYYPSIQFIRMMRFYHDGCAESIEPSSVQITKRMHLRAAEIKQHCLSFRMKIKRNEVKFFE